MTYYGSLHMTDSGRSDDNKRDELEQRIKTLEQQARLTYDILEMASTLGDFQTNINKLQEPTDILRETTKRIQGFIPFQGVSYFLVDERTQDFALTLCQPKELTEYLAGEVDYLIENGVFSLALREHSPIHVHTRCGKQRLVMHSLSTSSRTRGMFVGLLGRTERTVSGLVLSLLSIILKNCANAIESFELYKLFRENECRYRELAEFLPHTLFETDPAGFFTFVSQGAVHLGLEPSVLCNHTRVVDLLDKDSASALEERLAACLEKQQAEGVECDVTLSYPERAMGKALLRMRPLHSGGECIGWRGMLALDESTKEKNSP